MKLKEQYYENSIVRLLKEYNDKFGTITENKNTYWQEKIDDALNMLKRNEDEYNKNVVDNAEYINKIEIVKSETKKDSFMDNKRPLKVFYVKVDSEIKIEEEDLTDIYSEIIYILKQDTSFDIGFGIVTSDDDMSSKTITEARMSRQAIREVIRDIIKTLKRKEEGLFQLPESEEEDFYSFNNYPVQFSVELTIKLDTKISRFMTNGKYSLEDDVVEVLILVNPNKLEEQLYDIIGELNNLIAHELEHGLQEYHSEFNLTKKRKEKQGKKYYMSPEELGAQVQGARRVAKLKQIPFEDAVREWFENNRDIHKMKPKTEEEVIQKILDYHQEKYGELNEFHNQKKIVNLLKEYNTKYDSLITEGNFQNTMESIVNDLLSELKTEAEEDSTNFRKEVYNWIDNVEKIEIVSYRKTQSVNNPEKKSFMFKINFEVYSLKTPTKGQLSPIIDQLELKLTRLMGTGDFYLLDIDKIINTNKIVE